MEMACLSPISRIRQALQHFVIHDREPYWSDHSEPNPRTWACILLLEAHGNLCVALCPQHTPHRCLHTSLRLASTLDRYRESLIDRLITMTIYYKRV